MFDEVGRNGVGHAWRSGVGRSRIGQTGSGNNGWAGNGVDTWMVLMDDVVSWLRDLAVILSALKSSGDCTGEENAGKMLAWLRTRKVSRRYSLKYLYKEILQNTSDKRGRI